MLFPLRQELVPSFGLRVRFVPDLEPAISAWLIDAHFSFGNDAFQIPFANSLEEVPAVFFDVLSVQEPIAPAGLNQLREPILALD
jgi:hypothetical protein